MRRGRPIKYPRPPNCPHIDRKEHANGVCYQCSSNINNQRKREKKLEEGGTGVCSQKKKEKKTLSNAARNPLLLREDAEFPVAPTWVCPPILVVSLATLNSMWGTYYFRSRILTALVVRFLPQPLLLLLVRFHFFLSMCLEVLEQRILSRTTKREEFSLTETQPTSDGC